MSFEAKELATQLEAEEQKRGPWLFMIGCGPLSVRCPDTQPFGLVRDNPIDSEVDPTEVNDLLFLKRALLQKLLDLGGLEEDLKENQRARLRKLEEVLGEGEIEELKASRKRKR